MTFNLHSMTDTKKNPPLLLVACFIVLNFPSDVTKLKNLAVILMVIVAIYYLCKDFKSTLKSLNNKLFYAICLFTVAMLYSVLISIDPALSLKEMNKPVLNSLFLFSFLIPIVLHKTAALQIAKMVLVSVAIGLLITCIWDLARYIENYNQGIIPFTEMSHRNFSDSYVFCFPVILCIWHLYKKNSVAHWVYFLTVSAITAIFMLGTFARGAWLAALVMSLIIIAVNKEKVLALLSVTLLVCATVFLLSYNNVQDHLLIRKMEQTSSSNRFSGGTQGTALELILQNPIKGYGFGNDLFHQVYNSQAQNHPEWIYKKSLGPHNVFLALWFAAGIFALLATIIMTITALTYSIKIYRASKESAIETQAILLLITSFIGWFVIRGNVENVYLNFLGIHFGLLMALGFRIKEEKAMK